MNQGQLKEVTNRLDTLIERTEPMKDEMYVALRSYLEEHSQLLRQILDEVKGKNNEPATLTLGGNVGIAANKGPVQAAPPAPKVPAEAVGPVVVETVETVNKDATDAKTPAKGNPGSAKPQGSWGS